MLVQRYWSAIAPSEAATHVTILSRNMHLAFCCPDTAFNLMHFSASVIVFSVEKNCCLSHKYIFNGYNILWQEVSQQVMGRTNPSYLFWACQLLVSFDSPNFVLTLYVHSLFKATNSMQLKRTWNAWQFPAQLSTPLVICVTLLSQFHFHYFGTEWTSLASFIFLMSFVKQVLCSSALSIGLPVKRLELYESSGMNLNHHNIMETHFYLFKPDHINYICNL